MLIYNKGKPCCATCENWAGEREAENGGSVVKSFDAVGVCFKENICSACLGHSAGERENCPLYELWRKLK